MLKRPVDCAVCYRKDNILVKLQYSLIEATLPIFLRSLGKSLPTAVTVKKIRKANPF